MRWDRLLADLEAAERARERTDMLGEAAERSRLETARISFQSRLQGAAGARVAVEIEGSQKVSGTIDAVGSGWLVLRGGMHSWLISTASVHWIEDLPRHAAPPSDPAAARVYESLGMPHALRGIAADRSFVQIGLRAGEPVAGTIDRVGADFVDVAVHPIGEPRRARDVRAQRTIRLDALSYVRRAGTS